MTRKHLSWIHRMDMRWEELLGNRQSVLKELGLVESIAAAENDFTAKVSIHNITFIYYCN